MTNINYPKNILHFLFQNLTPLSFKLFISLETVLARFVTKATKKPSPAPALLTFLLSTVLYQVS